MNKTEYLEKLEVCLRKKHLSKADIDDIIRDYAEFFEEGRRQSKPDAEISAKLGDPELVAQEIIEENSYNVNIVPVEDVKKQWQKSKDELKNWRLGDKFSRFLTIMLKILGIIILIPFALFFGGCLLAFLGLIIAILVSLFAIPLVCAVLSLAGIAASGLCISLGFLPAGLVMILGSVAAMSFSICTGSLLIWLTAALFQLIKKIVLYIRCRLFPLKKSGTGVPKSDTDMPQEGECDYE